MARTSKDYEVMIQKNEAKVEKKMATIEKKTAKAEKFEAELLAKYGAVVNHDNYREFFSYADADYNNVYKAYSYREDVKTLYKAIAEINQTIENQRAKLEECLKKENILSTLPPQFAELHDSLVTEWDRYDNARKHKLIDEYNALKEIEMSYEFRERREHDAFKAFCKKYSYASYEFMHMSSEEFHKSNVKSADDVIIDLIRRVNDITGEITEYDVYTSTGNSGFVVLNGFVKGENGSAKVESILAGGYNIQRLHIRTLVHKVA